MRGLITFVVLALLASLNGVEAGKKKKEVKARTLCPVDEIACPIIGSTTYDAAVEHHFKLKGEVTGIMAGQGGYECVNTKEALDSCGGCASTGEGRDCTKIRGAVGVGCEVGKCVVFSCKAGWRPALSGDKCVRAASYEGGRNATKAAGARRHMHRRRVSGHRNAAHLHS
ncbi:hypothetical protein JCM8202_001463 [Rhodotorula sphaerocarpa]